ncbi:hypothetical protein M7784_03075 [Desulfovibrio aminophilus]|nr:hypothetical protein [Desulfovibrio aminophilus]MCM0754227.1 hypothetical protein [Desulfovibrio aminophilus]
MNNNNNQHDLDIICSFLVDDILSATDEEILKEAAEDYSDHDKAITLARTSIGKARLTVARNKLSNEKISKQSTILNNQILTKNLNDDQVIRIYKIFTTQKEDMRLSMAARKGKDLTIDDMRTLLDDLQELGYDLTTLTADEENE